MREQELQSRVLVLYFGGESPGCCRRLWESIPVSLKSSQRLFPRNVASGLCQPGAGSILVSCCDPGKVEETWLGHVVQYACPAQSGNKGGLGLVTAWEGFGDAHQPPPRSFQNKEQFFRCFCGEFSASLQLPVPCLTFSVLVPRQWVSYLSLHPTPLLLPSKTGGYFCWEWSKLSPAVPHLPHGGLLFLMRREKGALLSGEGCIC